MPHSVPGFFIVIFWKPGSHFLNGTAVAQVSNELMRIIWPAHKRIVLFGGFKKSELLPTMAAYSLHVKGFFVIVHIIGIIAPVILCIIQQEFSNYEGEASSGIREKIRDKSIEKALALSVNIVGMTCNRVGAYDFSSQFEKFDVVIIDEVCKATLPEILLPVCLSEKAILVGDPKQLPPAFCSDELNIINKDIEDCHLNEYFHIDWLFNNCSNVVLLDTQYRMTKTIGRMISEVFYDGQLKTGRFDEGASGLRWVDYEPNSSSMIEETNAEGKHIIYNYPECDFVIFSITRTKGSNKFWTDRRRLNVALSRAKNGIIIIGRKKYAVNSPLLEEILSYC